MNTAFEELYLAARKKEGRLYSVEQVRKLPRTKRSDPHYKEWNTRRQSAKRFANYLWNEDRLLKILDVGCGNGWFSHYMLKSTANAYVTGQDVNRTELKLAVEAFPDKRIRWTYADVFRIKKEFDYIVLNSSAHYFPDLGKLLRHLNSLLKKEGEIHIFDSPFYKTEEEKKEAHQRTQVYYTALGVPKLTAFYTPHLYTALEPFKHTVLYRPDGPLKFFYKLIGKWSPFPWFRISKF
jgi:SAM-dependent methyltransferase